MVSVAGPDPVWILFFRPEACKRFCRSHTRNTAPVVKTRSKQRVASGKRRATKEPVICSRRFVYAFAASVGLWLPRLDAATLIDLDATQLSPGPLSVWTNNGALSGNFASAGTVIP